VTTDVFVVPLKDFDLAKERLRAGGATDVTDLARSLAVNVLAHCAPRHVIVLSESTVITRFALEQGVEVRESGAASLNEAVQEAYGALGARYERLLIVHGDLRTPDGLGSFAPPPGVTIVTDHHGRGTNLLVVPTGLDYRFAYGPDSAERHRLEAERLGVATSVITDSPWRFDVDEPEDLT
jgi:2-phospho-L-lactate guanylyltransferase